MSDEPIIEGAVWRGPLPTEAVHYEVVFVDGIGCLAEATLPTGERFYGFDPVRPTSG